MYSLELLGGGRMGEALLGGLLSSGVIHQSDVVVVELSSIRRGEITQRFPGVSVSEVPVEASAVIVATKPQHVAEALADIQKLGATRLLSIAAGVDIARLEAAAGPGVAVVRAMPNTPAVVGEGAAAMSGGTEADDATMEWAESILSAVGTVVTVPESALDAVTGLSGSGPAYVFLIAEALIEAGVLQGLPRATADLLVRQTLLGSAKLLAESIEGPEALRAAVTSPAGTTAAAVQVLERGGVRATIVDAVAAATARSKELGS